eukprot:Lankesteria_metandrocarpae@DN5221_c0_g1_i1.p2
MRCCILGVWLLAVLLASGSAEEAPAVIGAAPAAGDDVEEFSNLCKPLLLAETHHSHLLKNATGGIHQQHDAHLIELEVSLNNSDSSVNESSSAEYNGISHVSKNHEDVQLIPPDASVQNGRSHFAIENQKSEAGSEQTSESERLLQSRRVVTNVSFRAHQHREYNFGMLPENDGGLVLRHLSADLESIFGINTAATIAVIVLLCMSAIFVMVAIGLLLYYLARRNVFYLSEECQDSVASLFMSQIALKQTSTAKADNAPTDVPSDSASDSSGESSCATGARGYFILPHDKEKQQKTVTDSDCPSVFGEAVTNQMHDIVNKIATHGMAIAFNEATGIQMLYFRELKKSGHVAKTPLLDVGPPVYSSRFSSNDSRNSGTTPKQVSHGSSQTQFRVDSSDEGNASGRRLSAVPSNSVPRAATIQKKLDRKQSLYFAQAAVCNHAIPSQEFSFLEVEVCRTTKGSQVAVGVTPKMYPCFRLPGSSTRSVAYDSSGSVTLRHNNSAWFEGRASYTAGDFIGLLIKRFGDCSAEFHFYRNGRLQSFVTAPLGWTHKYHVCIGASGKVILGVNFGTQAVNYPPIVGARAGHFPFGELTPMSPRQLKTDGRSAAPVTVLPVTAFALQPPVSSSGYSPLDASGMVRGPRGLYYTGAPLVEAAKIWQGSPHSTALESSPTTSTVDGHSHGSSPLYQEHSSNPTAAEDGTGFGQKNAAALDAIVTEDRKKLAVNRIEPATAVDTELREEVHRSESGLSIRSADCSSVAMTPASKRP